MTDTERAYFGRNTTLTITPNGGSAIDTGLLQKASVEFESEEKTLTGCGSIFERQEVQRVNAKSKVSFEVGRLAMDLLGEILGTWNGSTGAGSVYDDSDPKLFDLVITGKATSTGKTLVVTVNDVSFPNAPILVSDKDEFMTWTFEGYGKDVSFVEAV